MVNAPSNNPNPASSSVLTDAEEQANKVAAGALKDEPGSSASKGEETPKTLEQVEQELVKVQHSYGELRKVYTQSQQANGDLQRNVESLSEQQEVMTRSIAELSEGPHDPDKFMDDLRAQGPKFLRTHIQGAIEQERRADKKVIEALKTDVYNGKVNQEVLRMGLDEEGYPDFKKMYPQMLDLANDPKNPVDMTKPVHEIVESLYNRVRESHSGEAIAKVKEDAKREADEAAAKEAATTVTGGGKSSIPAAPTEAELQAMPLEEVEKIATAAHGVAPDRGE